MASFYRATVDVFLITSQQEIQARLEVAYANRGYTRQFSDQTLTWERDLRSLRNAFESIVSRNTEASSWGLLLEFSIPRKEMRIDAVLLIGDAVVIIEAKTGHAASQARRQIEEYALLLYYFHQASFNRRIIPILVAPHSPDPNFTELNQQGFFPQLPAYWISGVLQCSWEFLPKVCIEVARHSVGHIAAETWDNSPYFPVPSIIEAALALRSGLSIREIAHSEASEHEIETVRNSIQAIVDQTKREGRHAICFLTGVPGSGKTLVGLSLAHSEKNKADAIHFMSGNGPLVQVLQYLFRQESMRAGARAPQASAEAKTLLENVHVFARYHTEDNLGTPSNHAIIFDEAQRAWNRAQNKKKFSRDYSEPEMLLKIMERHEDWAVVVALVGGGQEINDGEAGLEEWGAAILQSAKTWNIYASPEVLEGGASTANHRLFENEKIQMPVQTSTMLHLRTSNRSLRAEDLAKWVNAILEGDSDQAAALQVTARFPVLLSRDLSETKAKLREQGLGTNRFGLAGSSGAARLRAEGLEPSSTFHADFPWEHWYLAEESDVRSSYRCEVFATEFEIQGLELDWIGMCWGGDFVWSDHFGWQPRSLQHGTQTKWRNIKSPEKIVYRRNAYRVLLTRARKGMVIFIPKGDQNDPTTRPQDFNATAEFLIRCGVTEL